MTYREKFFKEHPDEPTNAVDSFCPFTVGYETSTRCPRYKNDTIMACGKHYRDVKLRLFQKYCHICGQAIDWHEDKR